MTIKEFNKLVREAAEEVHKEEGVGVIEIDIRWRRQGGDAMVHIVDVRYEDW